MRFAAIDIGTNSVLLTIAERSGQQLRPLVERATITRIGKGVDRTRELQPDRVEATLDTLRDYASLIAEADVAALDVVGTSALRDARGGGDFCSRAERLLGVRPRVITGDEEARLTFEGALIGVNAVSDVVVADIGGGSTEIIVGQASSSGVEVMEAVSLDVGSVRLFERHVSSDPPRDSELEAARDDVRRALRTAPPPFDRATLVGVAGTVTTLKAIDLELEFYDPARVHGASLSVAALDRLVARLAALSHGERCQVAGLEPQRADVIVTGACVLSELARWTGVTEVIVSDRGVRWGLVRQLAARD